MAQAALAHRKVQSTDPSLSDEANRLLTNELRAVIGRDEVDVPADAPDHRSDRHATHHRLTAAGISIRYEVLVVAMVIAMTAFIAFAVTTSGPWVVAVAFFLMIPTTSLVAWGVMRLFDESEHLDPGTAAVLSAEGVGDPDHLFNELLHDYDGAVPAGR